MFDMFSETRRHAALLREFYDAYKAEGFSDEEAFALTHSVLKAILGTRV
jgi:hypothetical protein